MPAALARIASASLVDLLGTPFASDAQRAARAGELKQDLAAINAVLPGALHVSTDLL